MPSSWKACYSSCPIRSPYPQNSDTAQSFIMRFQLFERPIIGVPRRRNNCRLHVPARNACIDGAEPVHQNFELRAHTVIIQRNYEYEHIRRKNDNTEFLHIIFLYARTFVPAMHNTVRTGIQVGMDGVNNIEGKPQLFFSAHKFFSQRIGRAVPVRASFQDDDFHPRSPRSKLFSSFSTSDCVISVTVCILYFTPALSIASICFLPAFI